MNGLHLIAELHDCRCDAGVLTNVDALREACLAVCAVPGLTPVAQAFYQFMDGDQPAGATGAVILAESHLAVHTWPELKAVTLDLYVCNFSQDNSAAARTAFDGLLAVFSPQRVLRREILRGAMEGAAQDERK